MAQKTRLVSYMMVLYTKSSHRGDVHEKRNGQTPANRLYSANHWEFWFFWENLSTLTHSLMTIKVLFINILCCNLCAWKPYLRNAEVPLLLRIIFLWILERFWAQISDRPTSCRTQNHNPICLEIAAPSQCSANKPIQQHIPWWPSYGRFVCPAVKNKIFAGTEKSG